MKQYKGNVDITKENHKEWEKKLGDVTHISGYLSIYSEAELKADKLKSVGGNLWIYSKAELKADKLKSVGGNLWIDSKAELKALERVGGNLSIYSEAELNALERVGEDLYIYSKAELKGFPIGCIVKGGYYKDDKEVTKADILNYIWEHMDGDRWSEKVLPEEKRDAKIGMMVAGEML